MSGMDELVRLLWAPGNGYLIGAGVSAGVVPLGSNLGRAVAGRWFEVKSFDAETPAHGPVFTALGLDRLFAPQTMGGGALLSRIHDGSVRSLLLLTFAEAYRGMIPVEYQVFRRLRTPVQIYNMNVDGLASRIESAGVSILNLHGTVAGSTNWLSAEGGFLTRRTKQAGVTTE